MIRFVFFATIGVISISMSFSPSVLLGPVFLFYAMFLGGLWCAWMSLPTKARAERKRQRDIDYLAGERLAKQDAEAVIEQRMKEIVKKRTNA